jgi:putative transferase (TIGR04331 family)
MDAEVLPYHWDDRAKLFRDYLYLRGLHERLLRELADQLNDIHRVDHGLRYWRILIGPWLGYFTQMLFDRWSSIRQATQDCELSGTIVLSGHEEYLVPNDMAEFTQLFVGDDWNHHIYGAVLQLLGSVPLRMQEYTPKDRIARVPLTPRQRLKLGLAKTLAAALAKWSRDDGQFLLATYMPLMDEVRMYVRLGHAPQLWFSEPVVHMRPNSARRTWTVSGASGSEFETIARALIPRQVPVSYLEGYEALVGQTKDLPWPRCPRLIWTSNAQGHDDVFKCWAADKVERGSVLAIGQHGGHFGTGRWCFTEEHDIAICDRYFSWGWTDPNESRVKRVGQLKTKRPLGVRHAKKRIALLVGNGLPRYSYSMYSAPVARQWLDYFNDECAFVSNLPESIRSCLVVRLHSSDYGWDQSSRWLERFPDICLDAGRRKIIELIRESRLYISTYNATTYLESLSMNVPTVMFWNPDHWEMRASAAADFDALKEVGIFHDTPQSAARHVAGIWNDVNSWWQGRELSRVRQRFQERYCDLPVDLTDRIEAALREAQSLQSPAYQ